MLLNNVAVSHNRVEDGVDERTTRLELESIRNNELNNFAKGKFEADQAISLALNVENSFVLLANGLSYIRLGEELLKSTYQALGQSLDGIGGNKTKDMVNTYLGDWI